jgi:hypothetical protein
MSGIIKQYSRLQSHRISTASTVFTVPSTEDFTDGTWLTTDLCKGEFGVQMADDRVFVRTNNGILELTTTTGPSALWKSNVNEIYNINTNSLYFTKTGSNQLFRRIDFFNNKIETQGSLPNTTNKFPYTELHLDSQWTTGVGGPTTVWSLNAGTLPTSCVVLVHIFAIGHGNAGGAYRASTSYSSNAMFKNVAGTLTLLDNTVISLFDDVDTFTHNINVISGNIEYEVSAASTDFEMTTYIKYQIIQSNI